MPGKSKEPEEGIGMTEEEIQVGDYVAYNVSGNTEYGTVVNFDDQGYSIEPEDSSEQNLVVVSRGSVTKVQRGQ